jgi:chromate transporter
MNAAPEVSLRQAAAVWARIGLLSFGGPAGQIALMHRELVERRRWIGEPRFLHALNYCMLLPGPEATQLAIYVGWLLHRTAGGVLAGVLFVLPGFLTILALSVVYVLHGEQPLVAAAFLGMQAATLAIVVEAVLRLGRRALRSRAMVAIAALAFVAIRLFAVPFPFIVLGAALLGLAGRWWAPRAFPAAAAAASTGAAGYLVDRLLAEGGLRHVQPSLLRSLRTALLWLAIWWLPLAGVAAVVGGDSMLAQQGVFFSKTAVVSFGGAYAVLAYVAQQLVDVRQWIDAGEMLAGLALAETTPGPLIMVVQFVAFLAGFRHETALPPMAAGVAGSLVATWATFAPCFLWIFLGAPYIEALRSNRALHSALSAVTAAVVGVILNLAVWFAMHTLFGDVLVHRAGPLRIELPEWRTVEWLPLGIAVASLLAMLRLRAGLGWTLAASALAAILASLLPVPA